MLYPRRLPVDANLFRKIKYEIIALNDRALELNDIIETIPDGSGRDANGNGWIYGLRLGRLYVDGQEDHMSHAPYLRLALTDLGSRLTRLKLRQVMVSVLAPGGELAPHSDGPPNDLRFHLPVATNTQCYWWDEILDQSFMPLGQWSGPVDYCGISHSAVNNGDTTRIHIIADWFDPTEG